MQIRKSKLFLSKFDSIYLFYLWPVEALLHTVFCIVHFRHPMFPLMALMFEKCEQASSVSDMPTPESIVEDIQVFLLHQEKEQTSLLSGDPELDNLVRVN